MKSGKQPVQYITDRKGKQATEARKSDFERVFLFLCCS